MPAPLTPLPQLPPGSASLHITGLTPLATYQAVVAHLEPAPAVGFTPSKQVTFTTGGGVFDVRLAGRSGRVRDRAAGARAASVRACGLQP